MNIKPSKQTPDKQPRQKPKAPKKITPSYLYNSGLFYLQRFTSSSENFRTVMMRKVKKSCRHHVDQDYDECAEMVNNLVEQFKSSGLLDDILYTKGMVTSLRRSGKSRRMIFMRLKSKGLENELIEAALQTYDQESAGNASQAELKAALIFARKKRFGPFMREREIPNDKALASMARGGFSYNVCKNILNLSPEEAQEKLLEIY